MYPYHDSTADARVHTVHYIHTYIHVYVHTYCIEGNGAAIGWMDGWLQNCGKQWVIIN